MAARCGAAFRAAAGILGSSCLFASSLAAADPAPPPQPQPPAAPQPLALTRLSFERASMPHHLLHGALAGEHMLERYELSLSSDRQQLRGAVCLGKRACGHPAFLHGGVIAAVLDDCMGVLFLSSGNGTGFTANLNVNYRRPIPAGTPLLVDCAVLRVETGKGGARKVHLSARLLGSGGGAGQAAALDPLPASPTVYAEATALFVVKTVPGLESSEALVASVRAALGLR
jgi:acyl-coenzyme A thioesterase PaaI-like protein